MRARKDEESMRQAFAILSEVEIAFPELAKEVGDVTRHMAFDEAKDNFQAAARHGLDAHVTWYDGEKGTVVVTFRETGIKTLAQEVDLGTATGSKDNRP